MAFKSDKQRKGFFATNPIKTISNLNFKAREKVLDIQTNRAIARQDKQRVFIDKKLEKERDREAKDNILAHKKVMLEKIRLDKELAIEKLRSEQERVLESKKSSLQKARTTSLTDEEKQLLKNIEDRKQKKRDALEVKRLAVRSRLIKIGKGIGVVSVGVANLLVEKPTPRKRRTKKKTVRRKSSKKKTTKRKKRTSSHDTWG